MGNWSPRDLQDQQQTESWRFAMPSRNESNRVRESLESASPISDDATLLKTEEEAAQFVCEARRRCTRDADEVISTVLDAVARDYFRHTVRKQQRRVGKFANVKAGESI
jgi:hypothetical protein